MNEGRQGEQNETGAGTRNLNDVLAYAWAAAVSGTVWKTHSLKSSGLLTAEYKRGPLILWASRPGEGEAVQFSDLVVSALEDRVDRLNTAQVFERFKWAIQGRRRIRQGRNKGKRVSATKTLFRGKLRQQKELCLAWMRVLMNRAVGIYSAVDTEMPKDLKKTKRESGKKWKETSRQMRLRQILGYQDGNRGHIIVNMSIAGLGDGIMEWIANAPALSNGGVLSVAKYLSLMNIFGDWRNFRAKLETIKNNNNKIALLTVLKELQAASHRAHLARRVKPAPRRHRIRRPLYSRPQPPSAPLAPPVS